MCFINAAQSDESSNHRGFSRYINNPYMQPLGFPFNVPKQNYDENENLQTVDYDVNQINDGLPFDFIQVLQQKNQQFYPQQPQQFQQQQYLSQQQQYFSYQQQQQQFQESAQQIESSNYYAEKQFVPQVQVPENEIFQVLGPLEGNYDEEESDYQNENNNQYFSQQFQFAPAEPQMPEQKYEEDNQIQQQNYYVPSATAYYPEQAQIQSNPMFFNEAPAYQFANYQLPANCNVNSIAVAEIPQIDLNNNNQNIDFLPQIPGSQDSTSRYYSSNERDVFVSFENCSETAECIASLPLESSHSNGVSQATNVQEVPQDEKQCQVKKENELDDDEDMSNEPEILGRIRSSNKKNVVKNIMSAFKRFIQELDSENNEKHSEAHSAAVASKIQNLKQNHISASEGFHIDVPVERERVLSLYNESKVKPDSIEEMSKKFKRYIMSKQFNHYTIRLLVQHANYGSIFRYFLENHASNWLNQSKVDDPNGHKVMIEFLQAAYEDIGIIERLKKHEKRKAIYQ